MEKFVLIVAGGCGSRMNTDIPKQFLNLAGRPVLMRTMEQFADYDPAMEFVLVLHPAYIDYWADLCNIHRFELKHTCVKGGASRFDSVKNGLTRLPDKGLVFIHDGVRPLVSLKTIRNCEETALKKGNAVPVIPVSESLRLLTGDESKHADRNMYVLVQTPQTFQTALIKEAYGQPEKETFTDDASVCEAAGEHINLVDGNPENIKITRPSDLHIAEFLFLSKSSNTTG